MQLQTSQRQRQKSERKINENIANPGRTVSQDCPRIVSGLSQECLRIVSGLSQDVGQDSPEVVLALSLPPRQSSKQCPALPLSHRVFGVDKEEL